MTPDHIALVKEIADRFEHMLRFRHDQAHNGDVYVGGRYESCPLCEESRELIEMARHIGES